MTSEEERIKHFICGNKLEIFKKTMLRGIYAVTNEHKGFVNRIIWISCFFVILYVAASIGGYNAEQYVPTGDWEKIRLENELFNREMSMINNNHQSDKLVIETEWIRYNFTISNNYEKDAIFKIKTIVSNSGKNTWPGKYSEKLIPAGKSENIIYVVPVELEGMNSLDTTFEMYAVYEDGKYKGQINSEVEPLFKDIRQDGIRAISFSDYNALGERSYFFKALWVIVAPLAAITIKHLRDIFENR